MPTHPLAGKPAPRSMLIDVARLVGEYYDRLMDYAIAADWGRYRARRLERAFALREPSGVPE